MENKNTTEKEFNDWFRGLLKKHNPYIDLEEQIMYHIFDNYLNKMRDYVKENSLSVGGLNTLMLNLEHVVFYIGSKFIAVEYDGNQIADFLREDNNILVEAYDYSNLSTADLIARIIGIGKERYNYVPTLIGNSECENLFLPTNEALLLMADLGWDFTVEESITGINAGYLDLTDGEFHRLINCKFFDEVNGSLKTRIAKWIDFYPCSTHEEDVIDEFGNKTDEMNLSISVHFPYYYDNLWQQDLFYRLPISENYKYQKLPQVNRFIETYANKDNSETVITDFLSRPENEFILTMGLGYKTIQAQRKCEWQSEKKPAIKPDFFGIKANGYADIIEFKLPHLNGKSVVGDENRERFSAEISSYISQTRVYADYFDDPNNRKWVYESYGFEAIKPKRIIVLGRRFDFDSTQWVEIRSDYRDLEIITYDDLVDTVIAQFHR